MKKLIIAFVLMTAFSIGAFAQSANSSIAKTQLRQQERIHQGIKSGQLTKFEARRLRNQQAVIKKERKLAKADGMISRAERKIINRDQKIAGNNIYRFRHNRRHRV